MEIKKMGAVSTGKVLGVMYALFGLVFGLIFFLLSLLVQPDSDTSDPVTLMFGMGAPILLPIIYGIGGFVSGLLMAWVYNLVAKWVGGIKIEVK